MDTESGTVFGKNYKLFVDANFYDGYSSISLLENIYSMWSAESAEIFFSVSCLCPAESAKRALEAGTRCA